MATEDYVSVAADDWYQRRRRDAEGEFFRSVANQGPRQGEGGSTRQGIYCLTASGKLLGYRNAGRNPGAMREVLAEGLKRWDELEDSIRRPGAIAVPDHGPADERYFREPPRNGLIVKVHARALDKTAGGQLADAACRVGGGDEASRDHLWLTETEWRSLIPDSAKPGLTFPLPPAMAERIARFHLIDNTRGEPPMWRRDEVRKKDLQLTVERADPEHIVLRLAGEALLATHANYFLAGRGYDVQLLGYIQYDRPKDQIVRFDLVALGDHWGQGTFTRGARPGRTPLGITFELANGNSPADRVAPQAARNIAEYFGR